MHINREKLEAAGVSSELLDGIETIPSEIEHNTIVLTTRIVAEVDGLPADLGAEIRRDAEQRFLRRAEDLIPRGGRLAPVVSDVIAEVCESTRFERERLKPVSAAKALEPWLTALDDHGWRGPEKNAIESMLEQGEEPTAVEFRVMTTRRRTITRDDVRQFALGQRPRWQVDLPDSLRPSEFLARAGFPTDEHIAELERVAERAERQQYVRTSGPGHMVGREYR